MTGMDLYPPIEPTESGHLDVGDGHSICWETVGSPTGTPMLWLHGGPGAPASPGTRRYFDPTLLHTTIREVRQGAEHLLRRRLGGQFESHPIS